MSKLKSTHIAAGVVAALSLTQLEVSVAGGYLLPPVPEFAEDAAEAAGRRGLLGCAGMEEGGNGYDQVRFLPSFIGPVGTGIYGCLPALLGSGMQITFDNLSSVNRVIEARQSGNSGMSSGSYGEDQMVWGKVFGSWADQETVDSVTGYDARGYGAVVGADTALSNDYRLGVALAYADTTADSVSIDADQSAHYRNLVASLYGSYALSDVTEINFQVDGGMTIFDKERETPGGTAYIDNERGYTGHIGAGISHQMAFSSKARFVPSARLDYTGITEGGYTEKGTTLYNLQIDRRTDEELVAAADLKVIFDIQDDTDLSINVGGGYDFLDDRSRINAYYTGGSGGYAGFTVEGSDDTDDNKFMTAGLGLNFASMSDIDFSLRYDLEMREHYRNHTGSLKMRMPF